MAYGKSIELFLVNGTADSIVTAELSNWNGKAIKLPRNEVVNCVREDIESPGVYFLFCKDDDDGDAVYIGEAENVLSRIKQHLQEHKSGKEKYYWNNAVIFTGRDLNKALIRYLENRLVKITEECGRYRLLTKNTFQNTVIKESQIASMEEFIENIKILINALGYRLLEPIPKKEDNKEFYYIKEAKGYISNNGFIVLKGSKVSETITPSFENGAKSYFLLRKRLNDEGVIENSIFVKDYEFNSPSAASSVVLGRASNGTTEWKTENKKSIKDTE